MELLTLFEKNSDAGGYLFSSSAPDANLYRDIPYYRLKLLPGVLITE